MAPIIEKPPPAAVFVKTRMCRFFEAGKCTKGSTCPFAHSSAEQKEMPDLTCTRMCPAMIQRGGGVCDRLGCAYAHTKEELRSSVTRKEKPAPQGDVTYAQHTQRLPFEIPRAFGENTGAEDVRQRYRRLGQVAQPQALIQAPQPPGRLAPNSEPLKIFTNSMKWTDARALDLPAYISIPPGLEEWSTRITEEAEPRCDLYFNADMSDTKPISGSDTAESLTGVGTSASASSRSSSADSSRVVFSF